MRKLFCLLIMGIIGFAPWAHAAGHAADVIAVEQVVVRATHAASRVTAAHLAITNNGDSPARLIGFASPAAARGEIHAGEICDGIMRMRPVKGGLVIPAGETVILKPGGLHLMLMDLQEVLRPGDNVMLELFFENLGAMTISAKVVPLGIDGGHGGSGKHGRHKNH